MEQREALNVVMIAQLIGCFALLQKATMKVWNHHLPLEVKQEKLATSVFVKLDPPLFRCAPPTS